MLSEQEKKILKERKIHFYIIDANKLAKEAGLNNKISSIMEVTIFKICKIIEFDYAFDSIKKSYSDSKSAIKANISV